MPAVAHAHTISRHVEIGKLTIPLEAPIEMKRISQVSSFVGFLEPNTEYLG
jgi:hypothetical protein